MSSEIVARGLVLHAVPYRENDAILTVYFHEYGKLALLATGIRKPKSKNAAACQPFTHSEFTLILRQGLSRLIRASVIEDYRFLQTSLSSMAEAVFIAEYYYRGIAENQPDQNHDHFLMTAISLLNQGYDPGLLDLFAIAFILQDCGSQMIVNECVRCQNKTKIVSVSVTDGGFVCLDDCREGEPYYPVDVLRLIRYVNTLSIDQADKLNPDSSSIQEAKRIMALFLDEYCPIRFASRKFI